MRWDEFLHRTARGVALATVAGLLAATVIGVLKTVQLSLAQAAGDTSMVRPAIRAETLGAWTVALLAPAFAVSPLPERARNAWATVRSGLLAAAAIVLVYDLASFSRSMDPANGVLLLGPPAVAGLLLASWRFPENEGSDAVAGRWGQMLAVPVGGYLATIALLVLARSTPVDWGHDGLWVLLFGPVVLYGLLWAGAAWASRRAGGSASAATDL